MLDKDAIIETLKRYNFDPNSYVVISGAAMVLLGIKECTSDIDIAVTKEYQDYLLANYDCTFEKLNIFNNKVYFIDNIINFSVDYYSTNNLFVDGIPVQNPEDIIKLKKHLNREKDKRDIDLIKNKGLSVFMIKNIIFDLSEVFISGYYGVEKVIEEKTNITAEDFFDRKEETIEFLLETMRGKHSEDEYIQELLRGTDWGITVDEFKNIIRENLNIPLDGMIELVKDLQKNYNIILLSDHIKEWVEYILENNHELEVFKKRYFSYEIGMMKSDEGTFKYILELENLDARETIFIDDSPSNVEMARDAGIDGIVFNNIEELKTELTKRGIAI